MTNFIAMFSVVVKNYKGLDDEVTDFAERGEHVFSVIDAFIAKRKIQSIL